MSDHLPEGWTEVRLGDVCEPVSQRGPCVEYETFRYIDLGAIDNKSKRIAEASIVPISAAPSRAKQIVRGGDIVFSTVRVYLENIAEVPAELDGGIASTAFCVLRPAPGIASRYLYHYVTSRPFVLAVNQLQRGNSPPSVQDGDIRSQQLPLAPPQEQKRIASRIDQLFSRIEEGDRALERVQKLVERYRQSLLKAAVTGELTRDWRERNKGRLESGEALLARILKSRRDAWEKAELAKMKAKGTTPVNDKWKQKYEEPLPLDTADLPELPDRWVWASLDQLCSLITSGSRGWSAHYAESGALFIRAQNIKRDVLDLDDVAFVDLAGVTEGIRTKVELHDLLVTITGANVTKAARVTVELESAFVSQHVALVRPVLSSISSFLFNWIASPANGRAILLAAAYGAGKPGLSLEDLKRLAIALPPQAEQEAICDLVDVESARIESIASDAGAGMKTVHQLRQAILKCAFSGGLVKQDSSDQPASLFLERIAAERDTASSKSVRGRKKKIKGAA